MPKVLNDLLFLVCAAVFLSLLAPGVWQQHFWNVIDLGVFNELPQWLVEGGFVGLALLCLWAFHRFWQRLLQR